MLMCGSSKCAHLQAECNWCRGLRSSLVRCSAATAEAVRVQQPRQSAKEVGLLLPKQHMHMRSPVHDLVTHAHVLDQPCRM